MHDYVLMQKYTDMYLTVQTHALALIHYSTGPAELPKKPHESSGPSLDIGCGARDLRGM
jgi:hypothetical protein